MKDNAIPVPFGKIYYWLIATVLILPIFTFSPFFFPSDWPKTILFQIIMLAIVGMLTYETLFQRASYPLSWLKNQWLAWCLAVFIGVMVVASIFSVDPAMSFWGSPARGGGTVNL